MFENITNLDFFLDLADWRVLIYLALAAILLVLTKFANDKLSAYELDKELTECDNKAIAISFAGFIFAICLIIHGVLTTPTHLDFEASEENIWLYTLGEAAMWSSIGCGFLLVSRVINDKLILSKFSNQKELTENKNIGVGLVQAGSYIATALIIRANVTSPASLSIWHELFLALVWFGITQTLLVAFSFVYQFLTRYDMHAELKEGNVAVGISFAGNLIAFGMLIAFFVGAFESLLGLLIWAVAAAILLCIIRLITDKLLLPKHKLDSEISKDKNWGAGAIEAATAIGTSLIIVGSFF